MHASGWLRHNLVYFLAVAQARALAAVTTLQQSGAELIKSHPGGGVGSGMGSEAKSSKVMRRLGSTEAGPKGPSPAKEFPLSRPILDDLLARASSIYLTPTNSMKED